MVIKRTKALAVRIHAVLPESILGAGVSPSVVAPVSSPSEFVSPAVFSFVDVVSVVFGLSAVSSAHKVPPTKVRASRIQGIIFFIGGCCQKRVGFTLNSFIKMMNETNECFLPENRLKASSIYDRLRQLPGQLLVSSVPLGNGLAEFGYGFVKAGTKFGILFLGETDLFLSGPRIFVFGALP